MKWITLALAFAVTAFTQSTPIPFLPYGIPFQVDGGTITPDTVNAHKGTFDSLSVLKEFKLPYVSNGGVLYRASDSSITATAGTTVGQILTWTGFAGTGNGVASDGTNTCILTSSSTVICTNNGSTWELKVSGVGNRAIFYKNSTWIVLGGSGNFWSSTNLIDWTARNIGVSVSLNAAEWTGSVFVIGGAATGGDGVVATSATISGSWTEQTFGVNVGVRSLAWNGSVLVASGDASVGATVIRTSDASAASWTARTSNMTGTGWSCDWDGTISLFACVDGVGGIATSPTGTTWTARTSGVATGLFQITSNGNVFVAVGASGVILTSADGITWAPRTSGTTGDIASVTADGTDFYATGAAYTRKSTDDGVTWTNASTPEPYWSYPSFWNADSARINLGWTGTDSVFRFKFFSVSDSARITLLRGDSLIGFKTIRTDSLIARSVRGLDSIRGTAADFDSVCVNCVTALGRFHVRSLTFDNTSVLERDVSASPSDNSFTSMRLLATRANAAGNGFGVSGAYCIEDDSGINCLAEIGGVRAGGVDNTGSILLRPYSAGTPTTRVAVTTAGADVTGILTVSSTSTFTGVTTHTAGWTVGASGTAQFLNLAGAGDRHLCINDAEVVIVCP